MSAMASEITSLTIVYSCPITTFTHGPRAAPYDCCLPVRGPYSFNACIISLRVPYGFRYRKQPVNSPCGYRKGPARPHTYDARAGFLQILVVSIPLRARNGAARYPCRSRTGTVGYGNIRDFGAGPGRHPHGHRTGSMWSPVNYSTKPYVYNRVKPYGARSLCDHQCPLLLTWLNFNPSMDK